MKKLLVVLLLSLLFPVSCLARIGVGVNSGKIQIDDQLKPGVIYKLPPFTVMNTGDEPGEYEVAITYHQDQPELAPPQSWFNFSPSKFHLEPGKGQVVEITLNLPLKMEPGNYFAYLEGHPLKKSNTGATSVGVAAAAKLYFTVLPANFFQGLYYKAISFWKVYAPWPQTVLLILAAIILILIFKKYFNLNINLKKPVTKPVKKDAHE